MNTPRSHRYTVVYDISCDKERRRTDRLLKGWGHRIQKSVFAVTTSRSGIERLRGELGALGLVEGSILILRLQAGSQIIALGRPFNDPDQEIAYII